MPGNVPEWHAMWFMHVSVLPDLADYCAGVVRRVLGLPLGWGWLPCLRELASAGAGNRPPPSGLALPATPEGIEGCCLWPHCWSSADELGL